MDYDSLAKQLLAATEGIQQARTAVCGTPPTRLDNLGLLESMRSAWKGAPFGIETIEFVRRLDSLSSIAVRIRLFVRGRDRFIRQQISLESRLLNVDGSRLAIFAEAIAATRTDLESIPELQDVNLILAVRDISQRVQNLDARCEERVLAFNSELRELHEWCIREASFSDLEPFRCLLNEFMPIARRKERLGPTRLSLWSKDSVLPTAGAVQCPFSRTSDAWMKRSTLPLVRGVYGLVVSFRKPAVRNLDSPTTADAV